MTQSVSATGNGRSGGVNNFQSGKVTGDGTTVTITLGFTPRYVRVINETDTIVYEKTSDMVAANAIKYTSAADAASDTGSDILFDSTLRTVTLSATLAASGKSILWMAWG